VSKHTPGPWYTDAEGYGTPAIYARPDDQYTPIAALRDPYAYRAPRPPEADSFDELKANALLIAAAPDLLAACEFALSLEDSGAWAAPGELAAALRSAIAKATGEEEPDGPTE
jgi:hypothetical protein